MNACLPSASKISLPSTQASKNNIRKVEATEDRKRLWVRAIDLPFYRNLNSSRAMKLYKYIENPWGKFTIDTTELNLATLIADSFSLENSNYIFDRDIRIL